MSTLSELQAAGYQVLLEGEEIVCRWQGTGRPNAARVRPLIQALRQHKAEAVQSLKQAQDLPPHVGDWPADWLDAFIERAAIMEFDGGLPRPEAERRAEDLVRKEHRVHREQAACPSLPASVADSPSRER